MLALFHAFSMKCTQIHRAIKLGDDELVGSLDRELEPLVAAILAYKATSLLEMYMQLQFMSNLIREESDDRSRVVRNSASLSSLIDRYFGGASEAAAEVLMAFSTEKNEHVGEVAGFDDDNVLNDVILDSLPDRVAVITRDYRYLYSNAANSEFLGAKPIELVGRHLSEFIGPERFENSLKSKLDACFAGETVDCLYRAYCPTEADKALHCRMTPLRATKSRGEVIGALLVVQEVGVVPTNMLVA